jgi:hypothetical protein
LQNLAEIFRKFLQSHYFSEACREDAAGLQIFAGRVCEVTPK